jgi:hypothetical protein
MKSKCYWLLSGLGGLAALVILSLEASWKKAPAEARDSKPASPQVLLADTYNAVTRVHFTNIAVHKGSHKPGLVKRRFRADVKYWLMPSITLPGFKSRCSTLRLCAYATALQTSINRPSSCRKASARSPASRPGTSAL